MSNETFERRAQAAGAALRAAFVQDDRAGSVPDGADKGGPTMTTSTTTPVQQPLPTEPRRRRPVAWAAAAALVVAAGAGGAASLLRDDDGGDRLDAAQQPAVVLEGLPERPDYPISIALPKGLREFATYPGYRAFEVVGPADGSPESAYVVVGALETFDGVVAAELPSDTSSLLADRDDVAVSDVADRRVLDRPAHTFTLTTRPGQQARPVWCASPGACWFPLPKAVVSFLVVPSSAGPLVVLMEADPEGQAAGKAALQQVLDGIELG